jgi:hypothetical protein
VEKGISMSRLKDAILSINDRLLTIPYDWGANKKSRQNYLFQEVQIYNDQINRIKDRSTYSFDVPACLIELLHSEPRNLMGGVSETEQIWRLHIVMGEADSMDGNFDQNVTIFEYRDIVKTWIKSFTPAYCSKFMDFGEQRDYKHDLWYVYTLDFKSTFIDTAGSIYDENSPFITADTIDAVQIDAGVLYREITDESSFEITSEDGTIIIEEQNQIQYNA